MKKYSQFLKAKLFDIEAGKLICILNLIDAKELGILPGDRVEIRNKRTKKSCVATIDITETTVKEHSIGLFEDVAELLNAKKSDKIETWATNPLKSIEYIKNKMRGEKLSNKELNEIVKDIAEGRLTDIEASAFMSSVYMQGFDLDETISMTKALIANGKKIDFDISPIVDKHSVGGVNGRATMIIVPIIAAAGLYIPKTSSRSITSAAGTADAMEVLAPVDISFEKIKSITKKIGGVIVWGGAVELAPADDKIIQIEHPLALDPEGQVIASVLAKKATVGSDYVVIDLPVGKYAKIKDKKTAMRMAKKFVQVGKEIGMEVEAVITNGEEPSGKAFGAALEAKYVMEILEGKRFDNLAQKSCELAGAVLELSGLERQGQGYHSAFDMLESGKAYQKMLEIIKAQGGKIKTSNEIILSPMKKEIKASESGVIHELNIYKLTKIARLSGAPSNKLAGVMVSKEEGDKVSKGETMFTIYAENQQKLDSAFDYARKNMPYTFRKIIIDSVR